jgi:hypothetical protein
LAKPSQKKPAPPAVFEENESRAAVSLTVIWMLATMSCLAAQVVALATWIVARASQEQPDRPNALAIVPGVLLLVAVLTGLLSLAIVVPVHYARKARPPRVVTMVSLVITAIPVVLFVIQLVQRLFHI